MSCYMVWPGGHGMVWYIVWLGGHAGHMVRPSGHGIWYGLAGIVWYMVWHGRHRIVYGIVWQAWHGAWYDKWYGLAGMACYMVWYGLVARSQYFIFIFFWGFFFSRKRTSVQYFHWLWKWCWALIQYVLKLTVTAYMHCCTCIGNIHIPYPMSFCPELKLLFIHLPFSMDHWQCLARAVTRSRDSN